MEEKNKWKNTDLGQLQVQEGGGSLCNTFVQLSMHLQAITGTYFVQNFHKATRNADSSFDCPASIFSLCPSLDSYLKPTVLFCPPLSTDSLSSLRLSFSPLLPVSHSGPLCRFRAKTDKEILWVAPTQMETKCYPSCHSMNFISNLNK